LSSRILQEESMSKQAKVNLSRRSFIARAGALTTGAVASGSVVAALAAPSKAEAAPTPVPWPVPVLDPNRVRDAGYWGYWANDPFRGQNYGCSYGTASALIAEIIRGLGSGSPWETLPLDLFKWGKTGCVESGTLCGALVGCMNIFTLAAPEANVEMGTDLIRWYQETALPSNEMDFTPSGAPFDPKHNYPNQARSMSASPLCHISVSEWCKAAGKLAGSTDRKTRCSKLTGDVGKMAATILNRYVPGMKYLPIYPTNPPEYADCVHCHLDAPPPPTPDQVRLNDSLGTSNCKTCHPDSVPVYSKQ
jgi:hypothetical protein